MDHLRQEQKRESYRMNLFSALNKKDFRMQKKVQEVMIMSNRKRISWIGILPLCISSHILTAEAATDPIEEAVNKIMNRFIRTAKAIATPLGVISLVACAITFFWSTDQKSVDKAKSWFVRVLIALLLIYAAEPIINEIIELAKSVSGS